MTLPAITIAEIEILMVEPSKAQQRIISGYLNELGITNISSVTNGDLALEFMRNGLPDLVISAMYLEDMTGTDLVQTMRMDEEMKSIPFMLISSETHFRYLEPIRQAGVIAILKKPFKKEQLKMAIDSTLHYIDPGELQSQHFHGEDLDVLIVDDSFTARRHISRVLRNMGIEKLTEAGNGCEALELMNDHFFDLIVTDYNMPEMDGKELVEHIRSVSSQASIPILMVSSEQDESRIASVQQSGVSAVCDKPFDASTVKQLIEKIVN